jgi:hypothetical protein
MFTRVAARPRRTGWIIAAVAAAGALMLLLLLTFVFFVSATGGSDRDIVRQPADGGKLPRPAITATP